MRDDDSDGRAPWQNNWSLRGQGKKMFRGAAVIGGAVTAVILIMVIFTDPIPPLGGPAAFGTNDWTLVPDRGTCSADDDSGFHYSGELANHSDVARDFTVRVAFEVDGRREATGSARLDRLGSGQQRPIQIDAATSFPSGVPQVRCGVQVRHAPASG